MSYDTLTLQQIKTACTKLKESAEKNGDEHVELDSVCKHIDVILDSNKDWGKFTARQQRVLFGRRLESHR